MTRDTEARPSDLEAARDLFAQFAPGRALVALLTTASEEGRPHATWMFASRSSDEPVEILTITSPDSDKVNNIRGNPAAEWMLSSQDRMQHLYLEGEAEIVEDVAEIKRLWEMIGGKDRVFFMKYYNSGIGFAIIRTRVTAAVFSMPEEYRKAPIPLDDLR